MNKDGTDNFMPLMEGVQKMQDGLFALHMETPVGYRLVSKHFSEHEKCDLREIPFANIQSPYIVSRKHSHFKEIVRIMYENVLDYLINLSKYNVLFLPPDHFASRKTASNENCGKMCMFQSPSALNRETSCLWH